MRRFEVWQHKPSGHLCVMLPLYAFDEANINGGWVVSVSNGGNPLGYLCQYDDSAECNFFTTSWVESLFEKLGDL